MSKKPITVDALIAELLKRPEEQEVVYAFGRFKPTVLSSYRGFYDQLAIGYSEGAPDVTVENLLSRLVKAKGEVFQGYKGGDYQMTGETVIWCANYSECPAIGIVGVEGDEQETRLLTAHCDW